MNDVYVIYGYRHISDLHEYELGRLHSYDPYYMCPECENILIGKQAPYDVEAPGEEIYKPSVAKCDNCTVQLS